MSDIPAGQQSKVKGIADIVFLMDTTGRMQPVINDLSDNICECIDILEGDGASKQLVVAD